MGLAFPAQPKTWLRLAAGAGAFFLADCIVGLAAFSAITLGALWYFSLGWIRLQAEYAAAGASFGTTLQLTLAWAGVFVCLPVLVLTVYLAVRAFQLPRKLFRVVRG
jgi:hypothetical protein